jgi:hypothetical protein
VAKIINVNRMFFAVLAYLNMAPSIRRQINEAAKQMYTELNSLLFKFNKAKRIYIYWNKFKFNKLKANASLKTYKFFLRKIKLFFKEHVQNINEAIVSFKRRTNLLREHKRNLLLKKDLFYGRTQSEL